MKLLIKSVVVACLVVTSVCTSAFANTTKSTIAFATDTKVNDTIVKKGQYEVVFDDQSGELSIFKGAKLIAKTSARLEKRDRKARGTEVQTVLDGMDQKLVSISFTGSYDNVVVHQAGMQTGGN